MNKIEILQPGVPVILADGSFPKNDRVLAYLRQASVIIACDGAAKKLLDYGFEPTCIVGDMDSLNQKLKDKYQAIINSTADQETNDFTKAILKAQALELKEVVVLGATGQREDHTLGNIGLLAEHCQKLNIQMLTDYGCFIPLTDSAVLTARVGQQVSIFNPIGAANITTGQLKYPIVNRVLDNWWQGTLNEAVAESFTLAFDAGVVVVYLLF